MMVMDEFSSALSTLEPFSATVAEIGNYIRQYRQGLIVV